MKIDEKLRFSNGFEPFSGLDGLGRGLRTSEDLLITQRRPVELVALVPLHLEPPILGAHHLESPSEPYKTI